MTIPPIEAEVDIVAFRPVASSSSATSLAILSPEERAKMELSAAIVTLSAIGLKFGGKEISQEGWTLFIVSHCCYCLSCTCPFL